MQKNWFPINLCKLVASRFDRSLTTCECLFQLFIIMISSTFVFSIKRFGSTLRTSGSDLPIIRTPKYIEEHLKRSRRKANIKRIEYIRKKSKSGNLNVPIISCKNSTLNHHLGQLYDKFEKIPLASQGWLRTKYWGDYFIINSYAENPSIVDKQTSFNHLHLNPKVVETIKDLGFKNPTTIQTLAIPEILNGSNVVCCAETGSGKTLAYLAPVIHNLMNCKSTLRTPLPRKTPLGVVIVPGRELGIQISKIAFQIASNCGISVDLLIGDGKTFNEGSTGSDLVIATMGMICKLSQIGRYNINNVQQLVLDECDTLVDDTFSNDMREILKKIHLQGCPVQIGEEEDNSTARDGAQLIMVGATIPRNLEETFEEFVEPESLQWIRTDNLHKIMPHVTQVFLRMDSEKKAEKLIHLLKDELKQREETGDKSGILIFTNKGSACYYVSKLLQENEIDNLMLSGNSSFEERQANFEAFQKGEINILVSTDLGSRGLDTTRVGQVINFEFPLRMSDYIHRVGRTGRVGGVSGRCVNFIGTKYEIPLVQQIETAARLPKKNALPNVNANIRRSIEEYHEMRKSRIVD